MNGQQRTLRVDGLVNARDLGGLPLVAGGLTPSGVFVRSGSVDAVTPRGWEQLRVAGVRTVVDLRQPGERAQDRTERPDWVRTSPVDLDGLENAEFWDRCPDNGGTALYFLPHLGAMPERTAAVLTALAEAPAGGVLFHCTGGRDRTGLISLVLLTIAGVEPEAIVDDYLETVRISLPGRRHRRRGGRRGPARGLPRRPGHDDGAGVQGCPRRSGRRRRAGRGRRARQHAKDPAHLARHALTRSGPSAQTVRGWSARSCSARMSPWPACLASSAIMWT